MSQPRSAPMSPVVGSPRVGHTTMDHNYKGEKDTVIGELATRMRRLHPQGNKHRRGVLSYTQKFHGIKAKSGRIWGSEIKVKWLTASSLI